MKEHYPPSTARLFSFFSLYKLVNKGITEPHRGEVEIWASNHCNVTKRGSDWEIKSFIKERMGRGML